MKTQRLSRILLFIAFLFLAGCGSKKKQIQKTQFTTEIAAVERVRELQEIDVKTEIVIKDSSGTTGEKEIENFQAEIDDPSKKAVVTKKEKDGETVWEFENILNFRSGKEKSKESTNHTISTDFLKIDKSKLSMKTKRKAEAKASGNERNVNVDIERGFQWWVLIAIVVIYLVISIFKRSLNLLQWF